MVAGSTEAFHQLVIRGIGEKSCTHRLTLLIRQRAVALFQALTLFARHAAGWRIRTVRVLASGEYRLCVSMFQFSHKVGASEKAGMVHQHYRCGLHHRLHLHIAADPAGRAC